MRTGRIGGGVEAGGVVVEREGVARVDVLLNLIVARGVGKCLIEALRATTALVTRTERTRTMSSGVVAIRQQPRSVSFHVLTRPLAGRGPCRLCLAMSRVEHRD